MYLNEKQKKRKNIELVNKYKLSLKSCCGSGKGSTEGLCIEFVLINNSVDYD